MFIVVKGSYIMEESIPKKIHYCWLGGKEKSKDIGRCLASWKKTMPDYEIIEWNEKTFPFDKVNCRYVEEAIRRKKWAFVTDYMRLYVLYSEGGIYLDTDVELLKSLKDFAANDSFIGIESAYTLCTAVIGAKSGQKWIKELLELYEERSFYKENGQIDSTPNSQYIFNFFSEKENLQNLNEIKCLSNGLYIYPREFFSPLNYLTMKKNVTPNTYAIHYYNGTWKTEREKRKDYIQSIITRVIGEKNRQRLKKILKG